MKLIIEVSWEETRENRDDLENFINAAKKPQGVLCIDVGRSRFPAPDGPKFSIMTEKYTVRLEPEKAPRP